ncbi:MAG: GNAT family N-acetyltransferase, partial [Candidatus Hermodarchaeota archaeon]|nr:GNAT family N-acetyltransferase [Candidatus Hermodarchaeota archaeon]
SHDEIRRIEAAAGRAWPAKHQQQYGGWLLRATEGVTRRANSVLPLGNPPGTNLEEALDTVRAFYQQHQLPMRFQLTTASLPHNIDESLEAAGLIVDMRVEVRTAPLQEVLVEDPKVAIVVFGTPIPEWLNAYQRFAGYDAKTMKIRQEILKRIPSEKAFATAIQREKVIGTGIAVVDGDLLGLFGLITDPAVRRHGIATAITQSLILWGMNRGSTQGYLQVEEHNEPAKALYSRLGFEETYTYWYRVAPE